MNEMVRIEFPMKYEIFSRQVQEDSQDAISGMANGNVAVYAKQIIIDLDECAKRKGRKLTEDEEEFLLTRHIRQEGLHIYRLANRVYIQKARGNSKCEVHLPMEMMDVIKQNALSRNKTLSQMFVEMADFYLLTYGDTTIDVYNYISKRHDDLQYQTGGRPEKGKIADKRTREPYSWPDYPRITTLDKKG